MLEVRALDLPHVLELVPKRFADNRGWFSESWNAQRFADGGVDCAWVQDNQAYSREVGVLRGLHFQRSPHAQAKLVRVVRGAVFDVAVDIRKGSPDFGKWVGLTLSASAGNQIFVPRGFAHGYMTLEPDCEVLYKVDAPYAKGSEASIHFADPDIGIEWPQGMRPVLSDKDMEAPRLSVVETGFSYP